MTRSPLLGAYVLETQPIVDERGSFARTWCREEFRALGLNTMVEQCSTSFNRTRGTLRGMHFQAIPHEEVKLVRCTRGAVYDVILDLRKDSATFGRWFAVELTADNGKMLYIPCGFAHGFQTLDDQSEVFYQISEKYHPEAARGVRWNDPVLGIKWPISNPNLSERDRDFPDFSIHLEGLSAR
jgi:dTDP-4-dehydrorhamnose 3,5-epimerase